MSATELAVVMGWGFRVAIPRAAIALAEATDDRVWGWGVHGWKGRWLVNGSSKGLVRIEIDPPAPSRVCGFRIGLRELTVSVDERERFLGALGWS